MALTLLEAQKHAKTPQELAVVTELAAGQLMSVLPFRNIEGNGLFWKREESLPDVGFRNYNGALAESYAEVSQQSESLKLFGGDIKVDRAIVDMEGAERQGLSGPVPRSRNAHGLGSSVHQRRLQPVPF